MNVLVALVTDEANPSGWFDRVMKTLPTTIAIDSWSSIYRFFTEERRENDLHELRWKNFNSGFVVCFSAFYSGENLVQLLEALAKVEESLTQEEMRKIGIRLLAVEGTFSMHPNLHLPRKELVDSDEFLVPSQEIWPGYLHPVMGQNLRDLPTGPKANSSRGEVHFFAQYNGPT